jgi:CDP-diglyceride synthetase
MTYTAVVVVAIAALTAAAVQVIVQVLVIVTLLVIAHHRQMIQRVRMRKRYCPDFTLINDILMIVLYERLISVEYTYTYVYKCMYINMYTYIYLYVYMIKFNQTKRKNSYYCFFLSYPLFHCFVLYLLGTKEGVEGN